MLTPYQRLLMSDIAAGRVVSWTYAPSNHKNALYRMIYTEHVCQIVERTVGTDTRLYQFVELTEKGKQMMNEMTQGRLL